MWRVFKKTFKLICQYRYDYASRKKEREERKNTIEASEFRANFLRGYDDIPDKSLSNFSLFGDTPAELVDYDLIIYDTYDYLDKLIGFKLSDIFYAIFHQYYQSTKDERALRLAKYVRFGTDTEREIWMLKYGLTFEDIEWASPCIDSIDEREMVFNKKYHELTDEQRLLLERFYHPINSDTVE